MTPRVVRPKVLRGGRWSGSWLDTGSSDKRPGVKWTTSSGMLLFEVFPSQTKEDVDTVLELVYSFLLGMFSSFYRGSRGGIDSA